jgi:hypothetical protein
VNDGGNFCGVICQLSGSFAETLDLLDPWAGSFEFITNRIREDNQGNRDASDNRAWPNQ